MLNGSQRLVRTLLITYAGEDRAVGRERRCARWQHQGAAPRCSTKHRAAGTEISEESATARAAARDSSSSSSYRVQRRNLTAVPVLVELEP